MTNYWIVTSALAATGAYSQEEKFHQTVITINSIRSKSTNNHITLVEGSPQEITGIQRRTLDSIVDDYVDCWWMDKFQSVYYAPNRMRQNVKGHLEAILIQHTLKTGLKSRVTAQDRLFKLSGRYWLNDQFNLAQHVHAQHKWCTTKMYAPHPLYNPTQGQIMTRLYSACGSLIEKVDNTFDQINELLVLCHRKNQYMDLEHAFCACVDLDLVQPLTPLGVSGYLSQNTQLVTD